MRSRPHRSLGDGGGRSCRESGPHAPEACEGRAAPTTSKTHSSLVTEDAALSSENKDKSFYLREIFSTFYIHFFPLGNRQTVGKKTEDHTKGEVRLLSGLRARAPP